MSQNTQLKAIVTIKKIHKEIEFISKNSVNENEHKRNKTNQVMANSQKTKFATIYIVLTHKCDDWDHFKLDGIRYI